MGTPIILHYIQYLTFRAPEKTSTGTVVHYFLDIYTEEQCHTVDCRVIIQTTHAIIMHHLR